MVGGDGPECGFDESPQLQKHEGKSLSRIRDLRIFRSVVETPEVFMMNLKSIKHPQSIKGLVVNRMVKSIESEIYNE